MAPIYSSIWTNPSLMFRIKCLAVEITARVTKENHAPIPPRFLPLFCYDNNCSILWNLRDCEIRAACVNSRCRVRVEA